MLKRNLVLGMAFFYLLNASAEDAKICKGEVAGVLASKLSSKLSDVQSAMQSSVKAVQSLSDSEKQAKKVYNISSSISYGFIGAGLSGIVAAAGVGIMGAGNASLSLRFSQYVQGETLRTNTVGIGGNLIRGAAAGAGGRAYYLIDNKDSVFDASKVGYDYEKTQSTEFDPYLRSFTQARGDLMTLQRKMLEEKIRGKFFNWNGTADLDKKRLEIINNFYLLQILGLEQETIRQSLAYLKKNCHSETIRLDMNVDSETKKILSSYKNLKDLDLEKEFQKSLEEKRPEGSTRKAR